MPAPFTRQLCGYRQNKNQNTSDANDPQSVRLGNEFFKQFGVPPDTPEPTASGDALEEGHHFPRTKHHDDKIIAAIASIWQ